VKEANLKRLQNYVDPTLRYSGKGELNSKKDQWLPGAKGGRK
jgi:hypothetical protein